MTIAWPAGVLVAGVVGALVCAVVGIVAAAIAGLRLKRHADRLLANPLIARLQAAPAMGARINHDLEAMTALAERARKALATLQIAAAVLRLIVMRR
ncbi:MAG: hypothetical protein KGN02_11975 [bacterium]|nr:hypothetical protein [bacterium]